MGLMESNGEDAKKYGLRIYTLIKDGPLDRGGAQELTDFIIPPEELYNNQINFQEWVELHANQEVTLSLYSLSTKKFRDIKILTNPLGSKDGVIGASVKRENWTIANKNVLHIVSVAENSFAEKELGLIPFEDYIIGVKSKNKPIIPLNQDDFTPLEILGEIIQKNKGKLLKFYIYNKNRGARDVTAKIGDDYYFSLGCQGAFGALHMFPTLEEKENKIENNIEETQKLLKEIKASINNIKESSFMQQTHNDDKIIENNPVTTIESTNTNKDKNEEIKDVSKENIEDKKGENNIEKGNDKNTNEEKLIQKKEEIKIEEIKVNEIKKDEIDNINKIAEEISVQKELENTIENEQIHEKEKDENQIEIIEEIKEEKINEEITKENLLKNQLKYKENENAENNEKDKIEEIKEELKIEVKEETKEKVNEEIKEVEKDEEEEKEEKEDKKNSEENNNNNVSQNKSKKRKKKNRH